ncbi:FtsX-like permease family protein [Candidatus Riflebacteria bacterium]
MLHFIYKGIIRDRSRSILPVLVSMAGVFLLFLGDCTIMGFQESLVKSNANFDTGHVKIVSHAYAQKIKSKPLELALEISPQFLNDLKKSFPGFRWTKRTNFGGLLDLPDAKGETRAQAPVIIMAMDFLGKDSVEAENLNIAKSLKTGHLIRKSGQILVSRHLAFSLGIKLKDLATVFCTTVDGASTTGNFHIAGTVNFGIAMLDKRTILMDISDADYLLDMQDYAAELLGFRKIGFDRQILKKRKIAFNQKYQSKDKYRPYMLTLGDQNNLGLTMDIQERVIGFFLFFFVFLMTLVLWNAGLINGLRRYSEIGVRLAIGERRSHIIFSMLTESLITGIIGTILGIISGFIVAYYLQEVGIDYTDLMKDISMMVESVVRTRISARAFWLACIPGFFASFLGMLMACIGIYFRETATLFKELET